MAQSKAKKQRNKLVREGRRNPERDRSPYVFIDMNSKTTKTKKDYINQKKYKKPSFLDNNGNEGFYHFIHFTHLSDYESHSHQFSRQVIPFNLLKRHILFFTKRIGSSQQMQ